MIISRITYAATHGTYKLDAFKLSKATNKQKRIDNDRGSETKVYRSKSSNQSISECLF